MTNQKPSAWAIRNFRFFTYAGLLMPLAAQVQSLIVGQQIYEIKHDPFYLGLVGLTEAVPGLTLALISGYLVDRSNPLKIYKNVVRLALFAAALLFTISSPWLHLSNEQKVPFIYLAAFLVGVCRGFASPARTAIVPQLVPREVLHVSSAWSTTTFSLASVAGPAVGGLLYAWGGPMAPYALSTVMMGAVAFLISRIDIDLKPVLLHKTASAYARVLEGLKYVFREQLLIGALALDMFAVLFGGAIALLPIFAAEILHVGPIGLGILRGATSFGALLGGLALIRFPVKRHSGRILLVCVSLFGFCMIGFGLSKSFWLSAALLALAGVFDSVSMVIRGATVQLIAPNEMRGRIGAVNSIFIGVSNQLGEFESGIAAKLLGTAESVIFGGILTLIVVAVTAVAAPKLRKMEIHKL